MPAPRDHPPPLDDSIRQWLSRVDVPQKSVHSTALRSEPLEQVLAAEGNRESRPSNGDGHGGDVMTTECASNSSARQHEGIRRRHGGESSKEPWRKAVESGSC